MTPPMIGLAFSAVVLVVAVVLGVRDGDRRSCDFANSTNEEPTDA